MRNRLLLTSAISASFLAAVAPAMADTNVDGERTDPIRTSTANGGNPDNIIIGTNGRVVLSSGNPGPAVVLDSDNTVTNNGRIEISNTDNAVGILVEGGRTGGLTNTGGINLTETNGSVDTDGDGDIDGPLATGTNRVGILIDGNSPFNGNVTNTAAGGITVVGNRSAGIRNLAGINGNLVSNGRITMTGDFSYGIESRSRVTGDLLTAGNIVVTGEDSVGIHVGEMVDGLFLIRGNVASTGYRVAARPGDNVILDDDDTTQGGSAIQIGSSIGGGIYLSGGDPVANITGATVTTRGEAPAIWIAPPLGETPGNIVISPVSVSADLLEGQDQDAVFDFGFVNDGVVSAFGLFEGIDSQAVRIEGQRNGSDLFTTTVEGGLLNTGTIRASSYRAIATAIVLGDGAIVALVQNDFQINANSEGPGGTARIIMIEAGAVMPTLRNSGVMLAQATGGGSAISITDRSDTLRLIENTGAISALLRGTDGSVLNGNADQPAEQAVAVAIDLSAATETVTFRQMLGEGQVDNGQVGVRGDIMLGSADDVIDISAGFIRGDLYFGTGADQLLISGSGAVSSSLHDADNDLSIVADGGSLEVLNTSTANIREARFQDGSRLIFRVDTAPENEPLIRASGTVTFETGSRVTASLANLIGEGASYVVLQANSLVIDEALTSLENTDAPYLYASTLTRDTADPNTLVLTLRRKTADELGMHANQAVAYNTAFQTWSDRASLGAAFAALTTAAEFYSAYNQLMPEYSASAIQFAMASNDSALGAVSGRLDAARRSPRNTGGIWAQEFAYFADRSANAFGPGYRGHGFGLAMGVDRPFGPFYAVGVNMAGAASDISESDGFDKPMTALTAQLGAYGGIDFGAFGGEFYTSAGVNRFEAERRVVIGSFDESATAEWTGWHYSASARFGRDYMMGDWYARPSLSVDYLSIYEQAYTETGGGAGIDLAVEDRTSTTFASTASFTVGRRFGGADSWWEPQFRVGYRSDIGGSSSETNAMFVGYNTPFSFQAPDLPGSGGIVGFAIQAGSDYSTFSLDYDADLRDGFTRHTMRLLFRIVF
ncbi:MAG: hypothetical protein CMF74_14615 [Maricaulis sp.]|jgi:uncharacterized protein with beta-barrel porin domain|nr:hypothetical protein [Maricaulis sp.]